MEKNFDERQQRARGKIFKHAVFIMIALLLLEMFLEELFAVRYFEGVWSYMAVVMIAIAVMTAEMIWKDAYPMSEKRQIIFFFIIGMSGAALLIANIVHFAQGAKFLSENALSENVAFLLFGLTYSGLGVNYFVKYIKNKRKKEEE